MTWLQTHSGIAFDLLSPTAEMVTPLDIAWSLARINRYLGHTNTPYTVAEHCCHVSDYLPDGLKLAGLLHDAHEAYAGDMPSPVKRALSKVARAEIDYIAGRIDLAICWHLGRRAHDLTDPAVLDADRRILLDERDALMGEPPRDWGIEGPPLGVEIKCWAAEEAAEQWLYRLRMLTRGKVKTPTTDHVSRTRCPWCRGDGIVSAGGDVCTRCGGTGVAR